jgi:uncharacterized membrane protein YccC
VEGGRDERGVAVLKKLIVLSFFMRKSFKDFEETAGRVLTSLEQDIQIIRGQLPSQKRDQELHRREYEYQVFRVYLTLKEWQPLN